MKMLENIVIIGLFILLICFALMQVASLVKVLFLRGKKSRRLEALRSRRKTREHLRNAKEWGRELDALYAIKEAWIK